MNKTRSVPKVLIRSTSQDQELARDMARRLRSAGLEPITDLALHPGEDFKKWLGEMIRRSDAVLFLLTPAALDSPWTSYETGLAVGADKPILLVIAGLGQRPLPPLLESFQAVPYDQFDEAVVALAQRLHGETATADEARKS